MSMSLNQTLGATCSEFSFGDAAKTVGMLWAGEALVVGTLTFAGWAAYKGVQKACNAFSSYLQARKERQDAEIVRSLASNLVTNVIDQVKFVRTTLDSATNNGSVKLDGITPDQFNILLEAALREKNTIVLCGLIIKCCGGDGDLKTPISVEQKAKLLNILQSMKTQNIQIDATTRSAILIKLVRLAGIMGDGEILKSTLALIPSAIKPDEFNYFCNFVKLPNLKTALNEHMKQHTPAPGAAAAATSSAPAKKWWIW